MIVIGILCLVLIGMIVAAYFAFRQDANDGASEQNDPYLPESTIDYSPATEEDKAYNDRIKEGIGANENSISEENEAKKTLKPVIVDANQYGNIVEVRAFVPSYVSSDGACKITFTHPTQSSVTAQVSVSPEASTTQCKKLSLDRNKFQSAGEWTVTVTYSAKKAEGTSDPQRITLR